MAQFDVDRRPDGMRVVDVQSDLIDTATRGVAPLVPLDRAPRPMPP